MPKVEKVAYIELFKTEQAIIHNDGVILQPVAFAGILQPDRDGLYDREGYEPHHKNRLGATYVHSP